MSIKRMEKKAKRAIGAAVAAVLPSRRLTPSAEEWESVRRVLLLRQDRRIGDLVMNTPLFRGVKKRFPQAHIALLIREGYQALFADDPAIDELIPFRPARDFFNPVGLAALVLRLRRGRYDLAIDCSNFKSFSLTNGLLTLLSAAPLRIGFEDKESPAFLNVLVPCAEQKHYAANQLDLLAPTGVTGLSGDTSLHISATLQERGRRIISDVSGSGARPTALVFTGAGNSLKRWGIKRYLEVAKELKARGMNVAFAIGPEDRGSRGDEPRSKYGPFPVLPRMPLGDFAGAINASQVFICGDTGPMHLAVACGVPTVSVFLEDNVERYGYHDGRRSVSVRVRDDATGVKEVVEAAAKLAAARFDAASAGTERRT